MSKTRLQLTVSLTDEDDDIQSYSINLSSDPDEEVFEYRLDDAIVSFLHALGFGANTLEILARAIVEHDFRTDRRTTESLPWRDTDVAFLEAVHTFVSTRDGQRADLLAGPTRPN